MRADQIAPTHFDPGKTKFSGNCIHQLLADKIGLVAARGPISRGRCLVSKTEKSVHAKMGQSIWARKNAAGGIGNSRTVRPDIRSLVMEEVIVDGKQAAFRIDRGANSVPLLARMICGDHVFAPVLQPFYRASKPHRRHQDEDVFRIDLAADTETTADMPFVKMDPGRAATEHARQRFRGSCGAPLRRRAVRAHRVQRRSDQ